MENRNKNSGFTLVEMIVSLGIFSIVAVVALGALVQIVGSNRKAQAMQSAISNISFALENISREMRVGNEYGCFEGSVPGPEYYSAQSCSSTANIITFKSSVVLPEGCRAIKAYAFHPRTGGYSIKQGQSNDCYESMDYTMMQDILDPEVVITGYSISVVPGRNSSNGYGRAMINIQGYTGLREEDKSFFNVQTTVSQRLSD